jgi:GDP-fucose protein O-fucosyltransferase
VQVVQLTKFDYRLANRLDTDLQKLRCKVNYHSLRFANQIQEMGDKLIQRMREKSQHFIALHLRLVLGSSLGVYRIYQFLDLD